jgi:hypothetical protein
MQKLIDLNKKAKKLSAEFRRAEKKWDILCQKAFTIEDILENRYSIERKDLFLLMMVVLDLACQTQKVLLTWPFCYLHHTLRHRHPGRNIHFPQNRSKSLRPPRQARVWIHSHPSKKFLSTYP